MNSESNDTAHLWHRLSDRARTWGFASVFSALLLAAIAVGGAALVPGSPLAGLATAYVVTPGPVRLDPSVYFYDGRKYSRAGRVVAAVGSRHKIELISEVAKLQESGLVAAVTPANLGQFIKLQSPEDLDAMRADLSEAVTSLVGDIFTMLRENGHKKTSRGPLSLAFAETIETPGLAESRLALSDFLHNEISPRVSGEIKTVFLDRVSTALKVIIKDALENYGTDLVRGRFDTAPISHAIDGMLADPRMLDLAGEVLGAMLDEPQVMDATQKFAARYSENLFDSFSKLPSKTEDVRRHRAEMLVRKFLKTVETLIYRNDAAHPVIVAVAGNVMNRKRGRSDAVLIVMQAGQVTNWGTDKSFVPVRPGWQVTSD